MDPESKKLLEETFRLSEENNKILRYVQRSIRVSRIITALYWVFIIGSVIGAFYFLQPYLDSVMGAYGGAKSNIDTINSLLQELNQ